MARQGINETSALKADEVNVEQLIAGLNNLDHDALKGRWHALRGDDPPKGLSRPLLVRALAYAIQEKAFGGLRPGMRQRLQRLGAELKVTGRIASIGRRRKFKPGTRLIREWQGRTHEVTVLQDGFRWNDETYRSLSAIARAITGTRWNGHVFFGLRSRHDSVTDHSAAGTCKARAANDDHGGGT
jgi:hypothetical protein